jgi:lysyl-tRNA synthetase class 2
VQEPLELEDPIRKARLEKLERLKKLGVDPYPHGFAASHTITEVVGQFGQKTHDELAAEPVTLKVAGRITMMRQFGKAGFLQIFDGRSKFQLYVRREQVSDRDFEVYNLLDVGDFVGAEGTLFRTRTGELTLQVRILFFLSKALKPLPEKWHGLKDTELRYRQRYLDLIANPEVRSVFNMRCLIIQEIRRFMDSLGYLEVETPMMQAIAGGAAARPFRTHHNALDMELYLRIAPELYLKRLIVGGFERVYEINRNFRNEGISTQHNPEFTMMEFYAAYCNYRDLMDLTEALLETLAGRLFGSDAIEYQGRALSLKRGCRRCSFMESISSATGLSGEQLRDGAALDRFARAKGLELEGDASVGKKLAGLFEKTVEPTLWEPTFVCDFPVEISPLAKKCADDPLLVERFELYLGGLEVANAYSELNDPVEQLERFQEQALERKSGDEEAHAMDLDYVAALEHGMPPTAGEGVGIDRLVMLLTNCVSIRDVILFPLLRPRD